MGALIAQLFATFLPIYQQLRTQYVAQHGSEPTDEQMTAQFEAHIADILNEGAAWKNRHPAP